MTDVVLATVFSRLFGHREAYVYPPPPHVVGDPGCGCGTCVAARPKRIQQKASWLRANHWAFKGPAGSQNETSCGVAILVLRAKLFDGVAPPARDEDETISGTLDVEPSATLASVKSIRRAG